MDKFQEEIKAIARKKVSDQNIHIKCPKCDKEFSAHKGENICPYCKSSINLDFDYRNF